jgi:hypothetical protein
LAGSSEQADKHDGRMQAVDWKTTPNCLIDLTRFVQRVCFSRT